MSESRAAEYACARCGAPADRDRMAEGFYRCAACGLDLAHLDVGPTGTVRGVIRWLRMRHEVLQDRYQIAGVLGRGGFAATYLVEDLRLKGKRRALKEIPDVFYDEYETELLSRLQHPAIPDIVDRFEAEGMMYLVLEFGGHRTLEDARRSRNGTIPVAELLPWVRQLCDVLSYLHGQDPPVVHRDLKPENILLDQNERVMLIDFGIAKASGEYATTRTVARSASHGFSPPEQVLGAGTDERSDVYSLGATMYALLTGETPPPAHQRVAGRELATPRALNPSIPAPLEAAIIRAVSLNIHHRQQSIRELRDACEPGALWARSTGVDTRVAAPTEPSALRTREPSGPAARPVGEIPSVARPPTPAPVSRPAGERAASWRAPWIGYAIAPFLLIGLGATWLALRGRPAEQPSPARSPATAPGRIEGGTETRPVSEALRPSVAETQPTAAESPTEDRGAATRAFEEEVRRRAAAERTARVEPPVQESAADRVRAALRTRDLPEVTVTFLDPRRVQLGNLNTEHEARRAKEIAASVLDPGVVVEVALSKRAASPSRRPAPVVKRREPEPVTPPPTALGWGVIRGEPGR